MFDRKTVPIADDLEIETTNGDNAKEEQRELDREKKLNEHLRTESIRNLYVNSLKWIVRSIVGVILIAIMVVAWHHLTPENFRWLGETDLSDLHKFLFSGAIVSSVTLHLQKHL